MAFAEGGRGHPVVPGSFGWSVMSNMAIFEPNTFLVFLYIRPLYHNYINNVTIVNGVT